MNNYNPSPSGLTKAETEPHSGAQRLLCIQTASFCKTSIFIIPNGREQNKAIGKQPSLESWRARWAHSAHIHFPVGNNLLFAFSLTTMNQHTNTKSHNRTRRPWNNVCVQIKCCFVSQQATLQSYKSNIISESRILACAAAPFPKHKTALRASVVLKAVLVCEFDLWPLSKKQENGANLSFIKTYLFSSNRIIFPSSSASLLSVHWQQGSCNLLII